MRVRIGNRTFRAGGIGVLLTLAVLATCIRLASWQLGRAHEKEALLAAFAAGTRTTVDIAGSDLDALPRYQHVRSRGHYVPDRQVLIDNMPSAMGAPGYRVLTPFLRDDGRGLLLVDRGWVPLGSSRQHLPDVAVGAEPRIVRGRLDILPVPGVRIGEPAIEGDRTWPRVLLFPELADIERALGSHVAPRIVLLDAELPDGYERQWRPSMGFGPERHFGYALQWFALAVTAVVAFVAMSLRRVDPTRPDA
jgi:surfeit locus 1 family protein